MGRFSSLQDETIHQILAGLRSHTQVAQLKTLSKKWLKIVSAYPVLEFFEEDYDGREESHWRICAEVLEKFSRGTLPIVAVRIKIERFSKIYVDFYDCVLDLAASSSPERSIFRSVMVVVGLLQIIISIPYVIRSQISSSRGMGSSLLALLCSS
ncbi:hypothetical protein LINPERHAP1_LOCUS37151 [Linum perenne]